MIYLLIAAGLCFLAAIIIFSAFRLMVAMATWGRALWPCFRLSPAWYFSPWLH